MKLDDDEEERENSDIYLFHKDLTFCTSLKNIVFESNLVKLMQNVKPVPVAQNSLPNEVESKQTKAKLRNWRYPNTLLDDFPCLSMRL